MTEVTRKEKGGAIQQLTPYERWQNAMILRAEMETASGGDGKVISEQILGTMAEAESMDALFAAQDASMLSGQQLVDEELRITDFQVVESDTSQYTEGLPFYLRINAVNLGSGEEIQFACGASNVVGILVNAERLDALPLEVRVTGKPMKSGGTLLGLKRIPKRAI